MDKTVIDIEQLKKKYTCDSLPYHLWHIALDCKRRRDAFWKHHQRLKVKGNIFSIPLLLVSSITGVTSVANLGAKDNYALSITMSVFGTLSALLTAMQKYFRYSERAEHARHFAKTYGRISRRIENMMVLVESSAITMQPEAFLKFVEDIQKDTDSLLQEQSELPKELMHNKEYTNVETKHGEKETRTSPASIELRLKGGFKLPTIGGEETSGNFRDTDN
jgi:hypothetical protein